METHPVIDLEQAALRRWCAGDPSGFLDLSAPDVVYFDPFLRERLDGFDKLKAYYESLRGKILAPKYEMIEPYVQEIGDVAVLTFRFNSCGAEDETPMRWNCTEVYRRMGENWRIVQTHWSFTAKGQS